MKKLFLFFALAPMALSMAPVWAQNAVAPVSSEAKAMALLDKSAAAYAALKGLSMKTAYYAEGPSDDDGKDLTLRGTTTLAFDKSGRARLVLSVNPEPQIVSIPAKDAASAKIALARAVEFGVPGAQLPLMALVQGKNPLRKREAAVNVMGDKYVWSKNARLLPDNGVAVTARMVDETEQMEISMYFDPNDHLLRRVDTKGQIEGKRVFSSTVLSDVQINPLFAADTFVLPKRTPGPRTSARTSRVYWDPKLKVGAAPYALKGVDLAKFKGKVVLLDFWATWCGPCVREVSSRLESYGKYHPKGFEIVGISADKDKKALAKFVKARKLPWMQLFDADVTGANLKRYKVGGIPFTLLIGKDGKIAAINPRGEELEPAIRKALAM